MTFGHVTAASAPHALEDFLTLASANPVTAKKIPVEIPPVGEVRIGLGSCCMAGGSALVAEAVRTTLSGLNLPVTIKQVGCVGMCHRTPLLEVILPGAKPALYTTVTPEDVPRLIHRHFKPRGFARRLRTWLGARAEELLTAESDTVLLSRHGFDIREPQVGAFFDKQKHIATEHYGAIDPVNLHEYRSNGGFEALKQCITEQHPEKIIETVFQAGLRGRGGAGFPTGVKWERVRANTSDSKTAAYIVCNGDEGDPGAFMDRMLLESYPYRIIEGMAIAARAVGATEGIFYIRAEYPLAVQRVGDALRQCREQGLIGERIMKTDFTLNLRIIQGAGAFVCGEETALIKSIEGFRGMPRFRPPYPARKGLWGAPTLVNNCETFACVPWIFRNGAHSFAAIGAKENAGTKVFSLAGKIRNGGLIEVPLGMTIREIVEQIGGGIANDRLFKAVQIGGPSGGCIPGRLADTPVDFQSLTHVGVMMGSGGLVVLDDRDCMVDIARYFLSFTRDQSCGRCTFCRVGTRRMLDILETICEGRGVACDIEKLEELALRVVEASLCGLGRTAPNPVLTTLRYFRDEYEAHLRGICPAGKCKSLIAYTINDTCIGCTICSQNCPVSAIPFKPHRRHEINEKLCIRCDSCRTSCPADAIKIISPKGKPSS
jgi:NADH-quinone oxidoreductase subunit F